MESQFQLTNSKEIIAYLAKHFPNCFILEGEAKPLKIGIFQDIVDRLGNEDILSKTKLRVALRAYTMSWRYLYSIKEGAQRVNLDGEPGEVITQIHVEHAKQQLKESKERAKERALEKRKSVSNSAKPPVKKRTLPKKEKVINVGDTVKVVLSRKPITVQVVNVEKEQIRVKVASGMELTVKREHIITQ
ncbi:RNA chaperone ProQ [Orbaceae bacterium ESL0727]|nr:RNA chaperone ProQ [Orbaceae bacterium ESL0727]